MRSFRTTLLLAVNLPLIGGFAVLLAMDYQRELFQQYQIKRISLAEEAKTLLPAVLALRHHGEPSIQALVDDACARMVDTESPGHHIAVRIGEDTLQATSHGRAAPGFAQAMERAAAQPSSQGGFRGNTLIVGSAREKDVAVFVSEYAANIWRAARRHLILRMLGMSAIGVVLASLVSMVTARLVARPTELLARTVHRIGSGEVGLTAARFNIRELDKVATEISRMSRSLATAAARRHAQLRLAWRIQNKLLPDADLLQSLGICHLYQPAEEVGGDFFDIHVLDEHRFILCLADVSGHGVLAAMGAALLKMLFQQTTRETVRLDEVLDRMNRIFCRVTPDEMFATMTLCLIDHGRGRLRHANAGHEPGYLIQDDKMVELGPTGMLLGAETSASWTTEEHELEDGDRIALFTDGLTEARSTDGRFLGRATARSLMAELRGRSPEGGVAAIMRALARHAENTEPADDLTVVACAAAAQRSTAEEDDRAMEFPTEMHGG